MNKDFEAMYNYFLHIQKDPEISKQKIFVMVRKKDVDELGNINNVLNKFYHFLVDYYNYNKHPKIVSDEAYEKIKLQEVYHGFTKFSHPATLLTHWNYHYGQGVMPGFYSTNYFEHAKKYTLDEEKFGFLNKNKVMKFKLNSKKSISIDDINVLTDYVFYPKMMNMENYEEDKEKIDELRNFIVQRDPNNAHDFLSLFKSGSILGIYLGYDTIIHKNHQNGLVYKIGLNRANMIIPKSEAERFMRRGKSFKKGVLNFIEDDEIEEQIYNER